MPEPGRPGLTPATPLRFEEPSLAELRRRRSYKWRRYPADVLPSFVAEMDYALAQPVVDAIVAAVEAGDCGYAWHDPELGSALADFAGVRFGWELDPAAVVAIPDVMAGVTELLRVALQTGDGVVVNTPVYPPFFSHIAEAGCRVVEVPLTRGPHRYELDLASVAAAFAAGARAYLLCNPHNPTGRVFSRDELEAVAELVDRYQVLVLADEIHSPLVLPGASHTPFLSLGEPATGRGITLVSATKGWNIPGLKCAQAVTASEATAGVVARLSEDVVFRGGNLGIVASIAAYRHGAPWLDEVIDRVDRNRRLMAELLSDRLPGVGYAQPEGGYLGWIDCRGLALSGEPADLFLGRGRLALAPGLDFGLPGAGHVRVTMATSPELLTDIVARMAAVVDEVGRPEVSPAPARG